MLAVPFSVPASKRRPLCSSRVIQPVAVGAIAASRAMPAATAAK